MQQCLPGTYILFEAILAGACLNLVRISWGSARGYAATAGFILMASCAGMAVHAADLLGEDELAATTKGLHKTLSFAASHFGMWGLAWGTLQTSYRIPRAGRILLMSVSMYTSQRPDFLLPLVHGPVIGTCMLVGGFRKDPYLIAGVVGLILARQVAVALVGENGIEPDLPLCEDDIFHLTFAGAMTMFAISVHRRAAVPATKPAAAAPQPKQPEAKTTKAGTGKKGRQKSKKTQ